MTRTAAIIGGGVIGGGWAARFLLNGWNVKMYDPNPEAERILGEVMANARRSLPGLMDVAMPPEGELTFCATVAEAVEEAEWIQESVPERLALKHEVLAEIQTACSLEAVIGSSTSGFKPSELQEGAARGGQIVVAHPFNPVYLLPLVEVVATNAEPAVIEKSRDILTGIGMYPLVLEKEIDAHVADRFLEAVWREALWLVKDGIATTEEIDNAIRYGFGIRWAQMGLFETYRTAGGEAGMRHFLAQFGPALKWPWTKLMDVPDFDDELVELIAGQSDAQSGHMTIAELLRARDDNLVSILRALKGRDFGAGALLVAQDKRLAEGTLLGAGVDGFEDLSQPLLTLNRAVPIDWADYNGHMTEFRYLEAFSLATDRFMEIIGCTKDYIKAGASYFTVETHIRHVDEVLCGEVIEVRTQMLLGQGKKLQLYHEMYAGDRLLATGEHFMLHVDLESRRPSEPSEEISAAMAQITEAQAGLGYPEGAGRAIRKPA
ncbi:carnitine 3-dehydrogenase [Marinibacterium profundimaris]|uniref:L-carnitine dehydrogenase n=1 Tax=Marinibacterium profundimaris TaxID=1679460 RepID=A0A225NCK2_9RHOB|nr:carnitine 3-dehydrogenase [Marinibacterium profundimaris]OWU69014.1 3-hydroxyacyl-CoA dehydrogenase [Marinibacterium profundimaris]